MLDRRSFLRSATLFAGGAVIPVGSLAEALANSRSETLLILSEGGPNTVDVHTPGANRPGWAVAWACYDRLVSFGVKTLPEGQLCYDYRNIIPALAKSYEVAEDGSHIIFRLRDDAKFANGAPVIAEDVKWSLDRAVSVPGFPKNQMSTGSLIEPEQFKIVDERTVRVDYIRPNKLLLPNLAGAIPNIFNSMLVRANATSADPWGLEYTKANTVGSGAFSVRSWRPAEDTILERNDNWTAGAPTRVRRIILRTVSAAATRRAMLERGDCDVLMELPPKDFSEIAAARRRKVIATPMSNTWRLLGMNCGMKPFDDKRVRQAVAWAVPYQEILEAALYSRGRPLFGRPAGDAYKTEWPTAFPYRTDPDKAKALLAEAGLQGGFSTTFSFDLNSASTHEPIALLLQEALGKVGIQVKIEKAPPGQLRGRLANKQVPFFIEDLGAWFDEPDYAFYLYYHGSNGPFNGANFSNDEMTAVVDKARVERDPQAYGELIRRAIEIAVEEVPNIPLVQPFQDVALSDPTSGHVYMFHRMLDYRVFDKSA